MAVLVSLQLSAVVTPRPCFLYIWNGAKPVFVNVKWVHVRNQWSCIKIRLIIQPLLRRYDVFILWYRTTAEAMESTSSLFTPTDQIIFESGICPTERKTTLARWSGALELQLRYKKGETEKRWRSRHLFCKKHSPWARIAIQLSLQSA